MWSRVDTIVNRNIILKMTGIIIFFVMFNMIFLIILILPFNFFTDIAQYFKKIKSWYFKIRVHLEL